MNLNLLEDLQQHECIVMNYLVKNNSANGALRFE